MDVKRDDSFPEFQSGQFGLLIVGFSNRVTLVENPEDERVTRILQIVDGLPALVGTHSGRQYLGYKDLPLVAAWAGSDLHTITSFRRAFDAVLALVNEVVRPAESQTRTTLCIGVCHGPCFFQEDTDQTLINLFGPATKVMGKLCDVACERGFRSAADQSVAEAWADLPWTRREDGVFVLS